ncbi:MAG: hypothetical protein R2850_12520 [Bacteroidia bacterium]
MAFYLGYQYMTPALSLGNITVQNAGADNGTSDIAIIKMDDSGQFYWIENIGSMDNEAINAVTILNSGKMMVAGTFSGFDLMLGSNLLKMNIHQSVICLLVLLICRWFDAC